MCSQYSDAQRLARIAYEAGEAARLNHRPTVRLGFEEKGLLESRQVGEGAAWRTLGELGRIMHGLARTNPDGRMRELQSQQVDDMTREAGDILDNLLKENE